MRRSTAWKGWIGSIWALSLVLVAAAAPGPLPYDEKADAAAALQQGLKTAQAEHKDVLVIFGANWCPDCRELDQALHRSDSKLIDSHFVVVKIDIGNWDHNLELAKRYGNPISKGIPAAVVLSPKDELLYATKAGELANARRMSDQSIYDFFTKVISDTHPHGA
jgi:thioredoxin 1